MDICLAYHIGIYKLRGWNMNDDELVAIARRCEEVCER